MKISRNLVLIMTKVLSLKKKILMNINKTKILCRIKNKMSKRNLNLSFLILKMIPLMKKMQLNFFKTLLIRIVKLFIHLFNARKISKLLRKIWKLLEKLRFNLLNSFTLIFLKNAKLNLQIPQSTIQSFRTKIRDRKSDSFMIKVLQLPFLSYYESWIINN